MTQPPEHPDPAGPAPWAQPPPGPPAWQPSPPPPYAAPPPPPPPQPQPQPPGSYAAYGVQGGYPGWSPGPPAPPPRRSKLPVVLGVAAAVVVLGIAIAVPVVLTSGDDDVEGADPTPTDLSEVESFEGLVTTHVTEAVPYEQTPPVGGPHFGRWLDCGVYDRPVPDEVAVHDLEHGTVWITYDADAVSPEEVQDLEDALPQNGIMSPYEGLDSPVVVTVWERQLALTGADDPRLPLFIEEFSGGVTAPEPMASCAGGLTAEEADTAAGLLTS